MLELYIIELYIFNNKALWFQNAGKIRYASDIKCYDVK